MKLKKIILIIALAIIIVFLFNALSIFIEYTKSSSDDKEMVKVEIPQGASENKIANILKEKGVIKHTLSFRLKMKSSPHRGKLNYGVYNMSKGMSLDDIIEMMLEQGAKAKGVKLIIPEGYSAEMIAKRCESLKLVSEQEFLTELESGSFDYDFLKDIYSQTHMFSKKQLQRTI